jgi:hypothetical protein
MQVIKKASGQTELDEDTTAFPPPDVVQAAAIANGNCRESRSAGVERFKVIDGLPVVVAHWTVLIGFGASDNGFHL